MKRNDTPESEGNGDTFVHISAGVVKSDGEVRSTMDIERFVGSDCEAPYTPLHSQTRYQTALVDDVVDVDVEEPAKQPVGWKGGGLV